MSDKIFEPQYPAQDYTKRPNSRALLSPIYDWTFKAMFSQETEESNIALKSFISAAIGREIKSVTVKSAQPPKERKKQKSITFDVCAEFDNGELSEIEMQAWPQNYDYPTRAEILAARLLSSNAKKGNKWSGPKVYQISILNFHCQEDDKSELSWYTLRDDSGKKLAGKLNVIFIDLVTIRQKLGTPAGELNPIEKWGLFLSYIDDKDKKQYIEELVRSEKGLMAAGKILRNISKSDDNWYWQNSVFIAECDRNTIQENLKNKAMEEGKQQKAKEDAKAYYANGVSIEIIAKSQNITIEQAKDLIFKG